MKLPEDLIASIPFLGSGLAYRRELRAAILANREKIDFVEVLADQFMNHSSELSELEELREFFPVIPHAVGLSIGSMNPLDREYLHTIRQVSEVTQTPYFSEHLSMTHVPGIDIGHLSPLWFSEEVLERTVENVCYVQDYLGKPLVLENVTYLFSIPDSSMSQGEFFSRLVDKTGCGVLLDVTNIYINSVNHHFNPDDFLKEMPLDKVVQVHVAGGIWKDDVMVDSHSHPVQDGSWRLLRMLTNEVRIKGSILEHDDNFPEDPTSLFDQVAKAREILAHGQSLWAKATMA